MAELQVMGSGDAFGSGGKFQTCFWLYWDTKNILVDAGATSSLAIKKSNKNIEDIDAIIVSHLHGDHIGGIPFILMELAYSLKVKKHKIEIFGPKGIERRLKELQELLYPGSLKFTNSISAFHEYDTIKEFMGFKIESFDVKHSELSHPKGIRLSKDNKVFAFSGDGEWSDNLIELSKEADIFICESFNYEKSTPGHLNYKTIFDNISLFTCKSIFLSHPGPELLKNIEKVELPVLSDFQIIEF